MQCKKTGRPVAAPDLSRAPPRALLGQARRQAQGSRCWRRRRQSRSPEAAPARLHRLLRESMPAADLELFTFDPSRLTRLSRLTRFMPSHRPHLAQYLSNAAEHLSGPFAACQALFAMGLCRAFLGGLAPWEGGRLSSFHNTPVGSFDLALPTELPDVRFDR